MWCKMSRKRCNGDAGDDTILCLFFVLPFLLVLWAKNPFFCVCFDLPRLWIHFVGSTVDARTHAGLTALHLASECGHTSVVCALLDHHRGPSIYNSKASIDTLESASSNDKSLDVNSWTTVEHFTALHVAAHSGHTDLIELLLSKYRVSI